MTSRRSRLKAVANLPVRRKIPSYQNSNEDVSVSENYNLLGKKSDEVKSEAEITATNICGDDESQEDTSDVSLPISTFSNSEKEKNSNNGDNNNNNNKDNNSTKKKLIDFGNSNLDSTFSPSVNICANANEINSTKEKEIKNINNEKLNISTNKFNNRHSVLKSVKSLASPNLPRKKIFLSDCESEDAKQKLPVNCIISDLTSNCAKSNNQKSVITEGVNCLTIFTSNNEETSAGTTTITITPLTEYQDNSNVAQLDCLNENFSEVEIYSELSEPSDLFINMPILEPSKNNEIPCINTDSEEPVLTTLVNCSADNSKGNSNLYYNDTTILSHQTFQQELYYNQCNGTNTNQETSKQNNGAKSSVTSSRDKLVVNHLIYSGTENVISNFDSCNTTLKKNVSTVKRKRAKCSDFTKKLADARREFQKKYDKTKPDRSSLKMIDLIFYNPATNPMESKHKLEKKGFSKMGIEQDILAEEGVDEPDELDCVSESQSQTEDSQPETLRMPVPQVKIGSNGEIILDEKSLVIETTELKKGREDLQNVVPIFEDRGSKVSYYRNKCRKSRDWTDLETKRFYKALNTIGPDFSLMQKYFPKRSRVELKNKFKREERFNTSLVDKALINPSEFDMTQLEKDLAVEKKAEEEAVEKKLCKGMKERQLLKRPRTKSSFLSREMIESNDDAISGYLKSSDLNSKKFIQNEKDKKKREIKFILQKFVLSDTENEINEMHKNYRSSSEVFVSKNEDLL